MSALSGLFVAVIAVVAYRWLLRRTQRAAAVDPDALVSLVQRHLWLQWYLLAFMLLIAAAVYATTSGGIELSHAQQLGLFIGGFVLLVAPLYIANRHD